MQPCHCGSGRSFSDCCEPYLDGSSTAPSAEALMRSRYSAYVECAVDYLGNTLHPDHRGDWDRDATRRWAEETEWLGLEIISTEAGQPGDAEGWVEFAASFEEQGKPQRHQELGHFRMQAGRWYYVDCEVPKPQTQRRTTPRAGRNDPCPCGSGKKFKRCCGLT